jgi:hypothetical protein
VFDSLGVNTSLVLKQVPKYRQNIKLNATAVQSPTSRLCGEFAVAFVIARFFNLDLCFQTLMNSIFSLDFVANENKVKELLLK